MAWQRTLVQSKTDRIVKIVNILVISNTRLEHLTLEMCFCEVLYIHMSSHILNAGKTKTKTKWDCAALDHGATASPWGLLDLMIEFIQFPETEEVGGALNRVYSNFIFPSSSQHCSILQLLKTTGLTVQCKMGYDIIFHLLPRGGGGFAF